MVCLREADDEPAELGVDAGVVLQAGGDGLAQRPERQRPKLHQWKHHHFVSLLAKPTSPLLLFPWS